MDLDGEPVSVRQGQSGTSSPEHEVQILYAVAEALNSTSDVRQALERTLSLVVELLGLRTGWVWLRDPDTQQYYRAAAQNLPPYLQEPVRMTGKRCWCLLAFEAGELRPENINMLECSRLRPAVLAHDRTGTWGLRYHASIPLYFRDTPLGIMNLTSPTWRQLSPEDLRLLSTIAYLVGIAIDRARLAENSTRLARAEERARIARDIHDTLAQGLTAIILQLEGASNNLESYPERARERLERALSISRQSLEDARRSVMGLRALPLEKQLSDALVSLARAFTSETGVRARVETSGSVSLQPQSETELFRIAQEALTNIRRHAEAREVEISLRGSERFIRLTVRDDGKGFEPSRAAGDRHGLIGMRERARLVGGRLRVSTRQGRGNDNQRDSSRRQ